MLLWNSGCSFILKFVISKNFSLKRCHLLATLHQNTDGMLFKFISSGLGLQYLKYFRSENRTKKAFDRSCFWMISCFNHLNRYTVCCSWMLIIPSPPFSIGRHKTDLFIFSIAFLFDVLFCQINLNIMESISAKIFSGNASACKEYDHIDSRNVLATTTFPMMVRFRLCHFLMIFSYE